MKARQISIIAGKAEENKSPREILFELLCEIKPTRVGPAVHPKSPKSAKAANIAVEAFGMCFAASENAPGHIGATAIPQKQQPKSAIKAFPESEATKYEVMQRTHPADIIFAISFFALIFA